jgi:hypothetical protein
MAQYKNEYTVCSAQDVTKITNGNGGGGCKYPWYDKSISVGQGFHVPRTQEDVDADRGRPTVPTKQLEKLGMKYRTYKAKKNGVYGYMCERVF